MARLFLSKYINNIDKKGRVSIPPQYRHILNEGEFKGLVIYQSIKNQCLEACSINKMTEKSAMINELDPYSDVRDAFETVILGGCSELPFDKEGRVVIPREFIDYAGIISQICLVGKGEVFELWQPDKFTEYSINAKKMAMKNKEILGGRRKKDDG